MTTNRRRAPLQFEQLEARSMLATLDLNDRRLTDWVVHWGQWITHDLDLTNSGLRRIINMQQVSLANVIRWNTDVSHIQQNVFFVGPSLHLEAPAGGEDVLLFAAGNSLWLTNSHPS